MTFIPSSKSLTASRRTSQYSNTVIGTLAVDGWAVIFGAARRGLGGAAQAPPRCNKCNSPPISGQCTNFVLFDVAILESKGLTSLQIVSLCIKCIILTSRTESYPRQGSLCPSVVGRHAVPPTSVNRDDKAGRHCFRLIAFDFN